MFVKTVRKTFFKRIWQLGFAIAGREWAQLQIQEGTYRQGTEWELLGRKLIRGNIRIRRGFLLRGGQGDQISPGEW